jgi:alpha-galactosidase
LPVEVKQTIRFWLDYWKKNYNVIFDGEFEPMQVSRFYPIIKVEHEQKTIYMLYEDFTVNLPFSLNSPIDVINSKITPTVQFQLSKSGVEYKYEIFNCQGVSTEKGITKTKNKNSVDLSVPIGGFIRIYPLI